MFKKILYILISTYFLLNILFYSNTQAKQQQNKQSLTATQQTKIKNPFVNQRWQQLTAEIAEPMDVIIIPNTDGNTPVAQDASLKSLSSADFREVLLFATNSIELSNSAKILSGDIVVNQPSSLPTLVDGFDLGLGVFTDTSVTSELYANSIFTKNFSRVQSDLYYGDNLLASGTLLGAVNMGLIFPVFATEATLLQSTDTGPNIKIKSKKQDQLNAGAYGTLEVGTNGQLTLSAGDYSFESVRLHKGAKLLFNGPTNILIKQGLTTDNSSFVGPVDGAEVNASDVIFFVAGENMPVSDSELDNPVVSTGNKSSFYANVLAPNAILVIGNHASATGAFIARDIKVGVRSELALDSAFVNDTPLAVNDSTIVNNAGTVTLLFDQANQLTIDSVLANDSDPNMDNLTVTVQQNVATANGILDFINADGSFSYTHDGSDTLSDSFSYEVCDDGNPVACAVAIVNITVNPETVSLSVEKTGTGTGLVVSSPAGINCGLDCQFDFLFDSEVTLTAIADANSIFVAWGGNADCSDGVITANQDIHCVAEFEIVPEQSKLISIVFSGTGSGTVTSNPNGINCGLDCSHSYDLSQVVTLTAVADSGSIFAGWSGNVDCFDGVLDEAFNSECVAIFNAIVLPDTTVTVTKSGTGSGTVTSFPAGIDCGSVCFAEYFGSIRVGLSAVADEGSVFVGWLGDSSCGDVFIGLGRDFFCEAVFDLIPDPGQTFNLNVTVLGGGTVSSNPSGILCSSVCSAEYEEDTEVRLFARPEGGFVFAGWTGDADCSDGMVTLTSDLNCVANFVIP